MPIKKAGFTLMEVLITVALISMVFLAAISLYTTGLKFLGKQREMDISVAPLASLEQVAKNIAFANFADLTEGGSQLNLRVDANCAGAPLNTPGDTAADFWWHYRLINDQLLAYCNNTAAPTVLAGGNPAGTTILIANINTATSTFQMIDASASGDETVVGIHAVATNPTVTIDTEVAVGAMPKQR